MPMSDRNKQSIESKKPYHHGDLRQQLVQGAVKLLREDGEAGLSMRKLAADVGVSRTAPYHHFKDKDELLCAIAEEGFTRMLRLLEKGADEGFDLLSADGMRTSFLEYVKFATENPEYYDLMFGGALWRSKSLTESLRQVAYESFRKDLQVMKRYQEAGRIRADLDLLRFSQVRWSVMHGMSRFMIDGIYMDSSAIEAMTETAVEMFLRFLD